jgi:cell shape-determining protein MreC
MRVPLAADTFKVVLGASAQVSKLEEENRTLKRKIDATSNLLDEKKQLASELKEKELNSKIKDRYSKRFAPL